MRINGHTLDKPREATLYIPLNDVDVACFKFLPVDIDFEKVLSKPIPPNKIVPGGQRVHEFDDPEYKKQLASWSDKKIHYSMLKSLESTEDLEFANVKMDDPETWHLWEKELTEIFGSGVTNRFWAKYAEANTLSEAVLEEARGRFLASRVETLPKE